MAEVALPFRFGQLLSKGNIGDLSTIGDHSVPKGLNPIDQANHEHLILTRKLGWVDTGHVRESMDTVKVILEAFQKGTYKKNDVFQLGKLPESIKLVLKKDVDKESFLDVAVSMAWDVALIHEIITVGVKGLGQDNSAFSPEDLVSDAIGLFLARNFLRKVQMGEAKIDQWDKTMNDSLISLLKDAGAVDKKTAETVFDNEIEGKWVKSDRANYLLMRFKNIELLKRNLTAVPWNVPIEGKTGTPPDWLVPNPMMPPSSPPFVSDKRAYYDSYQPSADKTKYLEVDIPLQLRLFAIIFKGKTTP